MPIRVRVLPFAVAVASALALATPLGAASPSGKAPATPKASAEPGGKVDQGRALALLVQRSYARAKDFSARFAQTYTYAALGRTKESTGRVMVKKPGLLRWEYETPDQKLLIVDGAALWQWVPDDNQVMVNRHFQSGELSAAFTFLWGKGDLTREFAPREIPLPEALAKVEGGRTRALELLPRRPSAQIQRVVFAVDAKGTVRASLVTDAQGNDNRLVFSEAKTDSSLPDALFHFEVPKGANVQELR
jgi:outer membrane lipoprotein carrier protein